MRRRLILIAGTWVSSMVFIELWMYGVINWWTAPLGLTALAAAITFATLLRKDLIDD